MERRRIVSDPKVMMGKPVVAGTRITVELILEKIGAGETDDEVLDVANCEGSLLLTADKDFGELVYRQRRPSTAGRPPPSAP